MERAYIGLSFMGNGGPKTGLGTTQTMKFSIKGFFSKCDQIRSFLRIWSHLLKKSLMEDFVFCAVGGSRKKHLNDLIN